MHPHLAHEFSKTKENHPGLAPLRRAVAAAAAAAAVAAVLLLRPQIFIYLIKLMNPPVASLSR